MKTILKPTKLLFVSCLLLLTACSCSKDDEGNNGEPKAEKGYATGKVVDGQGNPIAGAKILLDNTVYYASYIHGSTKEDGTYKVRVEPGSWRTFAYVEKEYNGQKYRMELCPDKTDSYSDEGAVRNFVWKLEGRMPWEVESYYGGLIKLRGGLNFDGNWDDIELTLTPIGPMIDGSQGKTIQLRKGDNRWKQNWEIRDIPISRYMVTAILKGDNGDVPLKIQDWYTQGELKSELQLDFTPGDAGTPGCSAYILIDY